MPQMEPILARAAYLFRMLAIMLVMLVAPPVGAQVCGNGVVELGEFCDPGPTPGDTCCTASCTLKFLGTICREATGECDLPEVCTGLLPSCPTNVFKPAGVCRAAVDVCDMPELCSGVGPACPIDRFEPPTTTCRAAGSTCDAAETCTGDSPSCPPDPGELDEDADSICDPLDSCPTVADPTQADSDADGVGDVCDPCTNLEGVRLEGARLTFGKLTNPGGDDRLKLKAALEVPHTLHIDPQAKGLRLVLTDGSGGTVVDAILPAGVFDPALRAGWRTIGSNAWVYQNGGSVTPRIDGIRRLVLKQDSFRPGRLRISVLARDGDYRAASGQPSLTLGVVVDAPLASTGQCGELKFDNTGEVPDCRNLNSGRRMLCREAR